MNKKTEIITINKVKYEIKALDTGQMLGFLVQISPFIALYEKYQEEYGKIIASGNDTPLASLFYIARNDMQAIPGEIIRMFHLLTNLKISVLKEAEAPELIDALIKLDRLNDFKTMLDTSRTLMTYINMRQSDG